jgi:hypothetical protein
MLIKCVSSKLMTPEDDTSRHRVEFDPSNRRDTWQRCLTCMHSSRNQARGDFLTTTSPVSDR